MAAPDTGGIFHFVYAVLATVVDSVTNKIRAQLGDVRGATDSDNAAWVQHVGFASRPSKASPGKAAAQVVAIHESDQDVCIGSQDERGLELYGNLKDGETAIYGSGEDGTSQGRTLYKTDGSVTLLTTDDNTKTGKVVALRLAPDGLSFNAPWGSFTFDAAGFRLRTKAGPKIEMGGLDLSSLGVPAALTGALTGYCKITAPKIEINGGIVELGTGPSFATVLGAPSAGLAPGAPSTPVMTGPTSQCATVRVTTP